MTEIRRCHFRDCHNKALPKSAAKGQLAGTEIDLYLCNDHYQALTRGMLTALSITLEPTPAKAEERSGRHPPLYAQP